MRVAVLGTGAVGRAWAMRLVELGHVVVVGTRDQAATKERDGHAWDGIRLGDFTRAVAGVELVINALNGAAAVEVLSPLGDALASKVLMDVTNPLDFSAGFPPKVFTGCEDSLGERIQQALPRTRVVKAVNTITADVQVHPFDEGTVFVAGDDTEAKVQVTRLLHAVGHDDVLDLGDITAARGLEHFMPLWLRLMGTLGTADFAIKVVRSDADTEAPRRSKWSPTTWVAKGKRALRGSFSS